MKNNVTVGTPFRIGTHCDIELDDLVLEPIKLAPFGAWLYSVNPEWSEFELEHVERQLRIRDYPTVYYHNGFAVFQEESILPPLDLV